MASRTLDMSGTPSGGHMSFSENLRGTIIRVSSTRAFLIFYVMVALLNFVTVAWSFIMPCPSATFIVLDIAVNLVIITETTLRLFAVGVRMPIDSSTTIDVLSIAVCIVALALVSQGCDLDAGVGGTIALVFRNLMQLARLLFMIQKNRSKMLESEVIIDLERGGELDDMHELLVFDDHISLDDDDMHDSSHTRLL